MKTLEPHLTGEKYDHKIAAIFGVKETAQQAADTLRQQTSVHDHQVFVVTPNDTHPGWELEPEDRGIWRTLVRAHVWLGLAGLVVGLVVFLVLFGLNIRFVVENAVTSALIAIGFGGIFGMMFGGLVTLRPDHMPYVSIAQSALRKGKFIVAVHAESSDQLQEAQTVLKTFDAEIIRTL
jgi:hypothetical protein